MTLKTPTGEIRASFQWNGFCPICEGQTRFTAENAWFRDYLICTRCHSIPRERALWFVLTDLAPTWRKLRIHESSPIARGPSLRLKQECPGYIASQFFPNELLGDQHGEFRNEDLERQTFSDESFDFVLTQDVMEHVFDPDAAHREIWRTLVLGGIHVLTTPIYKDLVASERRAELGSDGSVRHLAAPEYHGNPVDPKGALVTFHYGYDIADIIAATAPFDVEIRRFNDRTHGIVAEFCDVIVCRKRNPID